MKVHLKTTTIGQVPVGGDATIGGELHTVLDRADFPGIAEDAIPCFSHARKRVVKFEDDTSVDDAGSTVPLRSIAEGDCCSMGGRAFMRTSSCFPLVMGSQPSLVDLRTGKLTWLEPETPVTPEPSLEVRGEVPWTYVLARDVPVGRRFLYRGVVRTMSRNETDGDGEVRLEVVVGEATYIKANNHVYMLD